MEKTHDSDIKQWEHIYKKYETYNRTTEEILTDIWHNQATIIKWLSKIAENTK